MKKLIAALLSLFALTLLLSLAGCGGKKEPASSLAPLPTPNPAPTAAPQASPPAKKATSSPRPTSASSAASSPTEAPTPEPTQEPTPEPEPEDSQPEDTPPDDGQVWVQPSGNDPDGEDPEPPVHPRDFIGSSVEDLYASCGYPDSSEYGPSCVGPGEDGVLYYGYCTVYTYRLDGVETVKDVGE